MGSDVNFSAWGISWGGSWASSWGPYEVHDSTLEPAGHWKHLFRPIRGATTPEVKGKCRPEWRLLKPETFRIKIVVADTPAIPGKAKSAYKLDTPNSGTSSKIVRVRSRTRFSTTKPWCASSVHPITGFARAWWRVHSPKAGSVSWEIPTANMVMFRVIPPETVKNPTEEMLSLLFS